MRWIFFTSDVIDYNAIGRLIRPRRFGLITIFALTAVVAVDLALVQILGFDLTDSRAIWVGVFVSVFALAIVLFIGLVISDFTEKHASRRWIDRNAPAPDEISPPLVVWDDSRRPDDSGIQFVNDADKSANDSQEPPFINRDQRTINSD